MIELNNFGVVGDGVADDTAAIQAAVDACVHHGTVHFPSAVYRVSSTIETGAKSVNLRGEGRADVTRSFVNHECGGSLLLADFEGPIFRSMPKAQGGLIEGLGFWNYHPLGTCLKLGGETVGITVRECSINGHIGIDFDAGFNSFAIGCLFRCVGNPVGSVGILNPYCVLACDFQGWDHGVRNWNQPLTIGGGSRFEVCRTGIVLGPDASGAMYGAYAFDMSGLTFEGNDIAIDLQHAVAGRLGGIAIQGTPNAPSGESHYGIKAHTLHSVVMQGVVVNGRFTESAIKLGAVPEYSVFQGVHASNGIGSAWDVPSGIPDTMFQRCNN